MTKNKYRQCSDKTLAYHAPHIAIRARSPDSAAEAFRGVNEHIDDPVLWSDAFEKLEQADDSEAALLDLVTCSGLAVSGSGLALPLPLGALLGSPHMSGRRISAMPRPLHLPPLAIDLAPP